MYVADSRPETLRSSNISKTTTVQRFKSRLTGTWITKPFWVLIVLYKLEAEIRIPCVFSAMFRSKWKLKGLFALVDFTCQYKYLPVRPNVLMLEPGLGIWTKLLADIDPFRTKTFLPISFA